MSPTWGDLNKDYHSFLIDQILQNLHFSRIKRGKTFLSLYFSTSSLIMEYFSFRCASVTLLQWDCTDMISEGQLPRSTGSTGAQQPSVFAERCHHTAGFSHYSPVKVIWEEHLNIHHLLHLSPGYYWPDISGTFWYCILISYHWDTMMTGTIRIWNKLINSYIFAPV